MGSPAATTPKPKPAQAAKDKKPDPTPAELRAALGLPESASDTEVRSAQKVQRFKSVAKRRTDTALQAMHNLTRTANRGNYTYTDEQVKTIIEALYNEVATVEAAFKSTGEEKPEVQL